MVLGLRSSRLVSVKFGGCYLYFLFFIWRHKRGRPCAQAGSHTDNQLWNVVMWRIIIIKQLCVLFYSFLWFDFDFIIRWQEFNWSYLTWDEMTSHSRIVVSTFLLLLCFSSSAYASLLPVCLVPILWFNEFEFCWGWGLVWKFSPVNLIPRLSHSQVHYLI